MSAVVRAKAIGLRVNGQSNTLTNEHEILNNKHEYIIFSAKSQTLGRKIRHPTVNNFAPAACQ